MVSSRRFTDADREALGLNPQRTIDLFASTTDGYIIAQDIVCQHEYIDEQCCAKCGHCGSLVAIASINRSFQGLNEVVTLCRRCANRQSFIFDISNDSYQAWMAERMGELYMRPFDGPGRLVDPETRCFT